MVVSFVLDLQTDDNPTATFEIDGWFDEGLAHIAIENSLVGGDELDWETVVDEALDAINAEHRPVSYPTHIDKYVFV